MAVSGRRARAAAAAAPPQTVKLKSGVEARGRNLRRPHLTRRIGLSIAFSRLRNLQLTDLHEHKRRTLKFPVVAAGKA
jgi:hypothetical protein